MSLLAQKANASAELAAIPFQPKCEAAEGPVRYAGSTARPMSITTLPVMIATVVTMDIVNDICVG